MESAAPSHCFCSRTVTWQSKRRPVDITDGALSRSHGSETTATNITDETDARLACSKFELVALDRLTVHDHHERYSVPAMEVLARVQNVQVQG